VRPPGWTVGEPSPGFNRPHVVRPVAHAQPMRYQADGGKIFAGLTTVIIELNQVEAGQGGTAFLSGSHKAHFNCESTRSLGRGSWFLECSERLL
jgi:hypothetical protein